MLGSAASICLISVWKKPHDLRWFRLHNICALKCMLSLLYTKWTLFPNTFGNVPGFPGFCPERSFRRLFSSRITTFQAPRHTIFEETKPISSLQFTYKQKKNVLELEWMTIEKNRYTSIVYATLIWLSFVFPDGGHCGIVIATSFHICELLNFSFFLHCAMISLDLSIHLSLKASYKYWKEIIYKW